MRKIAMLSVLLGLVFAVTTSVLPASAGEKAAPLQIGWAAKDGKLAPIYQVEMGDVAGARLLADLRLQAYPEEGLKNWNSLLYVLRDGRRDGQWIKRDFSKSRLPDELVRSPAELPIQLPSALLPYVRAIWIWLDNNAVTIHLNGDESEGEAKAIAAALNAPMI